MNLVSWREAELLRDPSYLVLGNGCIFGVHGKELSQQPVKGGYLRVSLRDGKKYLVHRLVLEAFIGDCPPGYEASHEDGNPANNLISNLRWRPKSQNCKLKTKHGTNFTRGNQKLTIKDVQLIRRRFNQGEGVSRIARDFPQVSRSTVSHICHKRNWK